MRRILIGVVLVLALTSCKETEPITGTVTGHEYDDWDDTSGSRFVYDYISGEFKFKWVTSHDPAHWYLYVTTREGRSVRVKVSEALHDSCVVGEYYAAGQCE